ncbi:MAG: OmpH family outer membrane protein [Vicinamibacteria bacterium]
MKKTFLAILALVLAAAGLAVAQEGGTSTIAKLGVIDMARVSAESQLGKSYAAKLEKLQTDINTAAQEKQTALQKMDATIQALQEELRKQGAVLSQEARDKKQQAIVRQGRDRQAFLEDGQAEVTRMRERAQQQAQSINNEFQVKIRPIIEDVARAQGYDLVLDSQVAYTISREFDLTRAVIQKADEVLAAAAAPADASAPAAAPATGPTSPQP